jgi:hypothetical protein
LGLGGMAAAAAGKRCVAGCNGAGAAWEERALLSGVGAAREKGREAAATEGLARRRFSPRESRAPATWPPQSLLRCSSQVTMREERAHGHAPPPKTSVVRPSCASVICPACEQRCMCFLLR